MCVTRSPVILHNFHPVPHFYSPCTLVASHPLGLFAFRKEGGRLRDPGDPGCIESLRSPSWGQSTVPGVLGCCVLPLASWGVKPSTSSKIPSPYFLIGHWWAEKGEILAVTGWPPISGRWGMGEHPGRGRTWTPHTSGSFLVIWVLFFEYRFHSYST